MPSSVRLASAEQAKHPVLLDLNFNVRNGELLFAAYINILADSGGFIDTVLSLVAVSLPPVISLIASTACKTPITPTTGPRIPPSPQVTTLSAGGGFGKTHR